MEPSINPMDSLPGVLTAVLGELGDRRDDLLGDPARAAAQRLGRAHPVRRVGQQPRHGAPGCVVNF